MFELPNKRSSTGCKCGYKHCLPIYVCFYMNLSLLDTILFCVYALGKLCSQSVYKKVICLPIEFICKIVGSFRKL
jgi:uncharacterized membrane protein YcfT